MKSPSTSTTWTCTLMMVIIGDREGWFWTAASLLSDTSRGQTRTWLSQQLGETIGRLQQRQQQLVETTTGRQPQQQLVETTGTQQLVTTTGRQQQLLVETTGRQQPPLLDL